MKSTIHGIHGYQVGYNNYLPPDAANQWGRDPQHANGSFYNSSNGGYKLLIYGCFHQENQPHTFSLHMIHCVRRARQRL